jgi:hypothetical protein
VLAALRTTAIFGFVNLANRESPHTTPLIVTFGLLFPRLFVRAEPHTPMIGIRTNNPRRMGRET